MFNIVLSLLFLFTASTSHKSDCPDAQTHASDAYSYARKAYRADSFEELREYAKKAKSSAEDAQIAADDCGCDDASSLADDVATYAKKAVREDDFDEAVRYSRKAMNAASDLESTIPDCQSVTGPRSTG